MLGLGLNTGIRALHCNSMGDWAGQPYPALLTEPGNPATYGNFQDLLIVDNKQSPQLCAFIQAVALKNKLCTLFHLNAFSSLRTGKYWFHLRSWKVGRGKLSSAKPSVIFRPYSFFQTPIKRIRFVISPVVALPFLFSALSESKYKLEVHSWFRSK